MPSSISPRLLKGGIVAVKNNTTLDVQSTIVFQYNPETLNRSLQVRGIGEGGDRSEALRLLGPPVETFTVKVEIDATDQLEFPRENPTAIEAGIYPQLAVLETLIYPSTTQLQNSNDLARVGTLELLPMEAPLTLFVWSKKRILPVRLTEFSVEEQAYDPFLNPIRATVSLSLRVLNMDDLGFNHPANGLFMTYLQQKEQLASMTRSNNLSAFGIGGIR